MRERNREYKRTGDRCKKRQIYWKIAQWKTQNNNKNSLVLVGNLKFGKITFAKKHSEPLVPFLIKHFAFCIIFSGVNLCV